jgi:hypothetical protein
MFWNEKYFKKQPLPHIQCKFFFLKKKTNLIPVINVEFCIFLIKKT